MKNQKKILFASGLLCGLVLAFQNCGKNNFTTEDASTLGSSSANSNSSSSANDIEGLEDIDFINLAPDTSAPTGTVPGVVTIPGYSQVANPQGGVFSYHIDNNGVIRPPLQNNGQVNVDGSNLVIDPYCDQGDFSKAYMLPAKPLVNFSSLANSCSQGFETVRYNEGELVFKSHAGLSKNQLLYIDVATYTAADSLKITYQTQAGLNKKVLHLCRVRTWDKADPTKGTSVRRPPNETIRQFVVALPKGAKQLSFDYAGAKTPNYLRVYGMCEFDLANYTATKAANIQLFK